MTQPPYDLVMDSYIYNMIRKYSPYFVDYASNDFSNDRDFEADLDVMYLRKLYQAKVKLLALDPAMNNTGIMRGVLSQGKLWELEGQCLNRKSIEQKMTPEKLALKSSWKAAYDLEYFSLLHRCLHEHLESCHIWLAELPLGSQSAMAMKGCGAVLALLASLTNQTKTTDRPFIPIKVHQVRSLGKTKNDIIQWARETYPHAYLDEAKCYAEHEADALTVMHLGLNQEGLLKDLRDTQLLLGRNLQKANLGIRISLSPEETVAIREYEQWLHRLKTHVI